MQIILLYAFIAAKEKIFYQRILDSFFLSNFSILRSWCDQDMERLPTDLFLKIFGWLDHQNLAAAQMVCRKWREIASDEELWSNLFKERWGIERATFYAPSAPSQSWNDVYTVQDRCDRVGLGLKIIREGDDYYLVHQGQIQRGLGSRRESTEVEEVVSSGSILDKILFFIGDMEAASMHAKRNRLL